MIAPYWLLGRKITLSQMKSGQYTSMNNICTRSSWLSVRFGHDSMKMNQYYLNFTAGIITITRML